MAADRLSIDRWKPQLLPSLSGDLFLYAVINGYRLQMSNTKRGDGTDYLPPAQPIEVSGWLLPATFTVGGLPHVVRASMVCEYDDAFYAHWVQTMRAFSKAMDGGASTDALREMLSEPHQKADDAVRANLRKGIIPAFTELALIPNPSGKLADAHLVAGVQWKSAMRPRLSELTIQVSPIESELKLPTRAIMREAQQACGFEGTLVNEDGWTALVIERFGIAQRIRANSKRTPLTMSDHRQVLQLCREAEHGNRIDRVMHGLQVIERTAHARIRASKDALPKEWQRLDAERRASRKRKPVSTKKGKRR